MTKTGILLFCMAVAFGPLYTVDGYNVISNTISELGAQHTRHNYIMIAGFLFLALGLVADGAKNFSRANLPFMLLGAFLAMAGIFPHRPIGGMPAYNPLVHNLHSLFANLAGTSLAIGLAWQWVSKARQRPLCLYLAVAFLIYHLLKLKLPDYQGVIQRLMYIQVLAWLWFYFPEKNPPPGAND